MAAKAFVLVETTIGKNKDIITALSNIKGVKSVDTVTGPYDIIAVIESETLNAIGDVITSEIHAVEGISRTVTCLVV
ncbi:MAG: Lrp/AsnC ligand binding domain-containing protein [Dehalococcoidia bacterium]|nr:Lrp/AsnC ligand binding domain-containing protein [Dehalococcoidia bacterium]